MNLLDILLIALGLAMDCFAVSIACGIFFSGAAARQSTSATGQTPSATTSGQTPFTSSQPVTTAQPINAWSYLRIAFLFGLFQGLMPVFGWYAGSTFNKYIQEIDHWIAFGILLILGVKMIIEQFKNEEDCCDTSKKDPSKLLVVLTLAVATSIDALAVGISFSFLHSDPYTPSAVIALITLFVSLIGLALGHHFVRRIRIPAELLGGLVLIGIGIKILVEHLFL